jgi:biopolymer transport protein TolQ
VEVFVLGILAVTGLVVKAVLVILSLFSVVSLGIILFKFRQVYRANSQSQRFLDFFWKVKRFDAINDELVSTDLGGIENVSRALRRATNSEITRLERYLTFLATTGSTSPFIGLFGTVWGIMTAFEGIGRTGSASLAVVAPGIAEALIATAIGLVAAIPAVMAYNHFQHKIRVLTNEMDSFSTEFLNIVQRTVAGR